ncbi:MAG TPA: flagellar filament outer layer protein FlaA [Spirochaetota bacterium]|nr:flagellar filament outer layer protein FlaA [Spirochaetota bacterium]HQO03192.1 flagellar filament outer layer protein FlaA [Spirochaetota bacterium]HQP49337.1 flagellar filament outer layer protein FlaA [Spirochaetota bacterium]
MKDIRKIIVIISVLAVAVYFFRPDNAFSRLITNVPPDISAEQLKAFVVEDFEDEGQIGQENGWKLSSVPSEIKDESKKSRNPIEVLEQKIIPGVPGDMNPEEYTPLEKKLGIKNDQVNRVQKVFGVHFRFKYPGDNSVHIEPPVSPELSKLDRKQASRGIALPGRAKALSMWVHGRGNDYNLECWIKDYQGRVHILKFGSINFVGWRPVKTFIPVNIPQAVDSYPQTKYLRIERFVLRASPNAGIEDVYVFFDQLKLLTDDYEVNFDGQELHRAFDKGEGGTRNTTQQK